MDVPIKFHEHLRLTNVGISQSTINFINVTMQSERFIVCNDKSGAAAQVVIIDMADPEHPMKRPSDTDSVIMHPRRKIVALRFGKKLQIFDLDKKSLIKDHLNDEDVSFWKWIDLETIGIVTPSSVRHWTLAGDSMPVKVFDRHPTMIGCQIINYRADSDRKWLALIGISANNKANRVVGSMQLYSVERRVSQPIEGSAACFIKFKMDGNMHPSNLLVFALKNEHGGKLIIVELGSPAPGNKPYPKKGVDVPYSVAEELAADFPISMQASPRHGVVFVATKQGFMHIFDVDSAASIFSNRISAESIFITAEYSKGGLIAINRKGQVLSVSLDEQKMIEYVRETSPSVSLKLAMRWEPYIAQRYIPLSSISTLDEDERGPVDDAFNLLSLSMPAPPPTSLSSSSTLLTIGTPIGATFDAPNYDAIRIFDDDSERTERFKPVFRPSIYFDPPSSILTRGARESATFIEANYDNIQLDSASRTDRFLPPPSLAISTPSSISNHDTYSTTGSNYDTIPIETSVLTKTAERTSTPSEISLYSPSSRYSVTPTFGGAATYDTIPIESKSAERTPTPSGISLNSPPNRYSVTPTFGGASNYDSIHVDSNERLDRVGKDQDESRFRHQNIELQARVEKAEKERDEMTSRLREMNALQSDLKDRAERAEKERDEISARYYKLKTKCREAMCILGNAEAEGSPVNNNNLNSPVAARSNGEKRSNYSSLSVDDV